MSHVISLRDSLPEASIIRLHKAGLKIDTIQSWLNEHKIDYCTLGPNFFAVACAIHDYLCRTGVVKRYAADDLFFDIMNDLLDERPDELLWENLGRAYTYVAWAAATVGGIFGIGKPDVVAP